MQRWYVTGGAGSGKTTLARQLSQRLGVPHYDVDRGQVPDIESTWIVEGAHLWGMDVYVERADVVVWLDLPPRVTIPRILKRHVRLSLKGANPHRGLRNLWWFVVGQPSYYTKAAREPTGPTDWGALSRAATERLLRAHRSDIVWLRSRRDVRRWRRALAKTDRGD